MARNKKRSPEVEEVRTYVEGVAKNLADRIWGSQGPKWGTNMSQLEDLVVDIREILSEKMLALGLERQANLPAEDRPKAFQNCGGCGQPIPPDPDESQEPRVVQTRGGEATWQEPKHYCGKCRQAFFPQSKSLGLDRSQYSNAVLAKVIYAGSNNTSYQQAHADLKCLAELDVSDKQVRRLCQRIGDERVDERDAAVVAYQALTLVERKLAPEGVTPPELAVVGVDGGRVQIFERPHKTRPKEIADPIPQPNVVVTTTTDHDVARAPSTLAVVAEATVAEKVATTPEVGMAEEDGERKGKFWREDKIGLLMTMKSEILINDPCPQIPSTFLNPAAMSKLVRELKKRAPPRAEVAQETDDLDAGVEALCANETRWEPPEVQAKQMVATRKSWAEFGPMVATAAWAAGFFAASRKAFLGDGAESNWTLHRGLFSSFVPILDFIHGLSYVFASALAGRKFKEGWTIYERWIQWVWSGEVAEVLAELAIRQAELGMPDKDEPEGSPRAVVSRAITYLQNNKERMRYADYRKEGLPITSSYVESTVKQINYRVKGTEKFWNEAGAEAVLQLRGDSLSDGEVMEAYWRRREAGETGRNHYRRAK